jgi:hypothetical protein
MSKKEIILITTSLLIDLIYFQIQWISMKNKLITRVRFGQK